MRKSMQVTVLLLLPFATTGVCSEPTEGVSASAPATTRSADAEAVVNDLVDGITALPPWTSPEEWTDQDYDRLISTARRVQQSDPELVARALECVLSAALRDSSIDLELKPLVLMRAVFDLPEDAPASERRVSVGMPNWPKPNQEDRVSLAWPLSWTEGRPRLVGRHEGTDGPPYFSNEEYLYLLQRYPFRPLGER
jgi:hypothetical protein